MTQSSCKLASDVLMPTSHHALSETSRADQGTNRWMSIFSRGPRHFPFFQSQVALGCFTKDPGILQEADFEDREEEGEKRRISLAWNQESLEKAKTYCIGSILGERKARKLVVLGIVDELVILEDQRHSEHMIERHSQSQYKAPRSRIHALETSRSRVFVKSKKVSHNPKVTYGYSQQYSKFKSWLKLQRHKAITEQGLRSSRILSIDGKGNPQQNINESFTSGSSPATVRATFSYGNLGLSSYSLGSFLIVIKFRFFCEPANAQQPLFPLPMRHLQVAFSIWKHLFNRAMTQLSLCGIRVEWATGTCSIGLGSVPRKK
ncbi:hypothetical protein VNO77_03206 [Canavalia gladiata]|uniref:Uncharacterized protein n=1 Tax=Canavalia gladiata TaxID=3824 RepID=A0AAN9R3M3_CANGL